MYTLNYKNMTLDFERSVAKLMVTVTDERFSWKVLGERVCDHVARSTVNKTDVTRRHTITKRVNSVINVFGTLCMNRVFRHKPACAIILI